MTQHSTQILEGQPGRAWAPRAAPTLALAVLWCGHEPQRMGEVLLPRGNPATTSRIFGRGDAPCGGGVERLFLVRQRPGRLENTAPFQSPGTSREQLRFHLEADGGVQVENVGRQEMLVNGRRASAVRLRPGDLLELPGQLVFLCVNRPLRLLPLPDGRAAKLPQFGEPDAFGLVGESPAMWEMRRQIALVGQRKTHVLILGPSGTGKELVARALHHTSSRSGKPLISRNASTFPETLVDAELFGNARNYPNPGMAERPGLIGQSDGGTLFLDEIGELPSSLQAHLLRVLDSGEYQRLGDAAVRHADIRLLGATNRHPSELKHDLVPRFQNQISLPGLNDRPEDIPLLARHLVRGIAAQDREIAVRFQLERPEAQPLFVPELAVALVRHPYLTHVRELERVLWQVLDHSPGPYLELTEELAGSVWGTPPEVAVQPGESVSREGRLELTDQPTSRRRPSEPPASGPELPASHRPGVQSPGDQAAGPLSPAGGPGTGVAGIRWAVDPASISREMLEACLERHGGIQKRVWPELGLKNRFVLHRLMKKHGLSIGGEGAEGESGENA